MSLRRLLSFISDPKMREKVQKHAQKHPNVELESDSEDDHSPIVSHADNGEPSRWANTVPQPYFSPDPGFDPNDEIFSPQGVP